MEKTEESYFVKLKREAAEGDAKAQYLCVALHLCNPQKDADLLMRSSNQGYAPAQAEFGRLLFYGDDIPQNRIEAIRLWRLAAIENEPMALLGLGIAYKRGIVVRRNYAKAITYFEKALKKEGSAKCELADMYLNGLGVEKNIKMAERLYVSAATKDHDRQAMFALMQLYLNINSFDKAIKWSKRAADYKSYFLGAVTDGDADARFFLAKLYLFGGFGEYKVPVNARLGFRYLKLAADQSHIDAMRVLAEIYREGLYGLPKNYKKAIALYETLSNAGYEDAAIELGTFYYFGLGVKKDGEKAFEIYSAHQSPKYPVSYYYLGCCYDFGVGVEVDKKKAFKLELKAAKMGVPEAQYNVGVSYYWAVGVRRNYEKMFSWLTLSAKQGYGLGESNLAECYENGYGTSVDMNKAIYWYEKAAKQNVAEAIEALRRIKNTTIFENTTK